MKHYDVVIVGAGAAGMFCSIQAARPGQSVLVLDHAKKPGEKIRISGGGRCNFTNTGTSSENFISTNPHFAKSALARFSPWDFVDLVEKHNIAWHEKKLGQLFCDGKSNQIIDMLLSEMSDAGVELQLQSSISEIKKSDRGFRLSLDGETIEARNLVVATGGKSIPKMGASGFGYEVAWQFGLNVIEPRPGLVPFTLNPALLEVTAKLSGLSVDCLVSCGRAEFEEALLFTHRGLSGPAILQASSYWREGDSVKINLLPGIKIREYISENKSSAGAKAVSNILSDLVPTKLAQIICKELNLNCNVASLSDEQVTSLCHRMKRWHVKPAGSEGYRTAEVTLGGVDTSQLSSKTFEAIRQPGLYFIGEVVDVTGWLGGYNFQWAWASGWAAGQHLKRKN